MSDYNNKFFFIDDVMNVWACPLIVLGKVPTPEEAIELRKGWDFVVNLHGINPEFRSLVSSSLMMFHSLSATQATLETLHGMLEDAQASAVADVVGDMVASISVARRAATEGLENLVPNAK